MTTTKQDKLIKQGLAWDRAVARLSDNQGRVARNNARRAALTALRAMRAALDRDFPVVPKKVAPRRRKTRRQQAVALVQDGYRPTTRHLDVRRFIEAGLRGRTGPSASMRGNEFFLKEGKSLWFPTWAFAAPSKAQLIEGRRSHNKREELRALFLIEQAHSK